jgi:hypothetical protein
MVSLIKDKIRQFLENKVWISKQQVGFVSGKSCLTKLLVALEACDISFKTTKGPVVWCIRWIANYLTDRKIQVRVRMKVQNGRKF